MSARRLARIRARLERTGYNPWKDDTFALLVQVERLWADLSRLDESHARQAATIARVRKLADDARPLMSAYGEAPGIVSVSDLLAAIEGTDS